MTNLFPSKQTKFFKSIICDSTGAVLLSSGESGAGGSSDNSCCRLCSLVWDSTAQHYLLCWPDFQCETDPSMYPYFVVLNRFFVALCDCLFLFVSIFVCLCLSAV